LHKSGDKKTLCLFRVSHKLWNCSRDDSAARLPSETPKSKAIALSF
jgi:hypothetical protein